MAQDLTGGCACGTVRFRLTATPTDAGWCHCRTCQLNSGSPAMAFASVPSADYVLTAGAEAVARFASSDFAHRRFCARCGTPLLFQRNDHPEILDFAIPTLDTPDAVPPEFHIYTASRIGWAAIADDLPRHERGRPA